MTAALVVLAAVAALVLAVRWRLRWRLPAAEYGAYMASAAWSRRKRRWRRALRFVACPWRRWCRVCWSRDVQLHHASYRHLGAERHRELVPLCRFHHQEVTAMHRVPGVTVEAATKRYLAQTRVRVLTGLPVGVCALVVLACGSVLRG